jgi:hypothetical protein
MNKNTSRFIFTGLLIAWAFDFFLIKKQFGIAFSLWILLAIGSLFTLSYIENRKPHWLSFVLAGFSLALSTASFLRAEPFTQTTSAFGSLGLLILLTLTFTNGHWFHFRLLDYVVRGLSWIITILVTSWQTIFQRNKSNPIEGQTEATTDKNKKFWPILRGILLAIPFVFILASLLAEADPIFEERLLNIFDVFKIENISEYIFRTINVLLMAYIFIGVLIQAIYPKTEEEKPNPNKPSINKFLGSMEASIVLGSIIVLFASFLVIQFRYFFGGEANISETGFTYSEYARRGFGEIMTVAVLSLGIYYLFHSITKLETKGLKRRFSWFSVLIFLQVLVMLVSSYQRLVLYEQAYGFSRLRTYSHLFLPWLALLIVVVIILELVQRQGHLALALLIFATGFVSTCIVYNIDGSIARQNIQRATLSSQEGYALDYYYISELSTDAVPVILEGYLENDPATRDLLGANLACRWADLQATKEHTWQSFNLSYQKAETLLAQNQEAWKDYPFLDGESDYQKKISINGETYFCFFEGLLRD